MMNYDAFSPEILRSAIQMLFDEYVGDDNSELMNLDQLSDEWVQTLFQLITTKDPDQRAQQRKSIADKAEEANNQLKNDYDQIFRLQEQIEAVIKQKSHLKELFDDVIDTQALNQKLNDMGIE